MKSRNSIGVLIAIALAIGPAASVHAATNLVQNGTFSAVTGGTDGLLGQGTGFTATHWTNAGYNFVFTSAHDANTRGNSTSFQLWGPGSNGGGSNNGFTDSPAPANTTSPTNLDFVAMDGAFQTGPLSQSISGLTVGNTYLLTFYQAAAQQEGYTGTTTDQFTVSLGSSSQLGALMSDSSHGFVPWTLQSMYFKATSTTELLSFLNTGTPSPSQPPFALLDGVSLVLAPEPSSVATMTAGLLGLGAMLFFRGRSKKRVA
jgi:hypothetical protein